MKKLVALSMGVLMLAACSKEEPQPLPLSNPINLSSLKAGQQSQYISYETSCWNINGDFQWTGDTLIVSVLENDGKFFFHEAYTPNSLSVLNGLIGEPVVHRVVPEGDNLLIPERFSSPLFYFYGNDTLRLQPRHDLTLAQQDCKLLDQSAPFIGNDVGFVQSFAIGPVVQKQKTVVSCVPIFFNMDAYLVHDPAQLFMSHTATEEFGGNSVVRGWVLME